MIGLARPQQFVSPHARPTICGCYRPRMEDFVQKMIDKTGIDKDQAHKVIEFLKDHADEAVAYIQKSGVLNKLPGGLGDKLGKLF